MDRNFNISGPCRPEWHYMLPAAPRLAEVREYIDEFMYVVVHAPRQTGKTTALRNLATELTTEGNHAALVVSCERSRRLDVQHMEDGLLDAIQDAAFDQLPAELHPPQWPTASVGGKIRRGLGAWARDCPRPLVIFFDEFDTLSDACLELVLGQIREGFAERPDKFPASLVLCGLRDVRDYQTAFGADGSRLGTPSSYNIKVESLRLGDFSQQDIHDLYAQHTAATGQKFTAEALAEVWDITQGQPWLVNAIARRITRNMKIPLTDPITLEHVVRARKQLISARATNLESLVSKLGEERVRRIIAPMMAGQLVEGDETFNDDLDYVRDLGLIAHDRPLRFANPIYREVIVRVLRDLTLLTMV